MNIKRFVCILLLFAALGLGLGAVSGGLMGAAVPKHVEVHGQSDLDNSREPGQQAVVAVTTSSDREPWQSGAALGGGIGLFSGVGVGFLLGIFDQILFSIRGCSKRSHSTEGQTHA